MAPLIQPTQITWRDLVWTLVRTDFKIRYHGTWGGFFWSLLKPLAMFAVLQSVFSLVFMRSPDYVQRLLIGLFLYNFFEEATKAGIISLHKKSHLLTKTAFPRGIVVFASIVNAVITLLVWTVAIFIFIVSSGRAPTFLGVVVYFLVLGEAIVIVAGISLGLSALFLRYRDLNQVWEVLLQAGFFLSPIIFPIGILPERFHIWLYVWPPTPIIEFARAALLGGPLPTVRGLVLLTVLAGSCLGGGAAIFRRIAPRAVESL